MVSTKFLDAQTWPDVEHCTDVLADQIAASGFKCNFVIALARGGFIPSRLLAQRLNVRRLSSIGIAYANEARDVPIVYDGPPSLTPADRVLLVEDAIESGRSLQLAATALSALSVPYRTAAYFIRHDYKFEPNFYLDTVAEVPPFPWD